MKKFYFLPGFFFFAVTIFAQKHDLGIGYQMSLPESSMKNGWNSGHGMQLNYLRNLDKAKGLSIGVNIGIGTYAVERQPQEYVFRDGTVTNTEAVLSSNLGSAAAIVRYAPLFGKKVSPFAEVQGGYFGMNSRLYIEDPADPFGCKALENRNLVKSGTGFGSFGAGIHFFLGKARYDGAHLLEISGRALYGGKMDYANMNRIYHDHSQTDPQNQEPVKGEKPLIVTFINVNTNELHDHAVAELYNHALRALQFNLSYTYRFTRLW